MFLPVAIWFILTQQSNTFDLNSITGTVLDGLRAAIGFVEQIDPKNFPCKFYQCCRYKRSDGVDIATNLTLSIRKHLFGQPIVEDIVTKAVNVHLKEQNRGKALVISLHGGTGVGKTYTASLIAKAVFGPDFPSKYVHVVDILQYKDKIDLNKFVGEKIGKCSKSIFIYDEVDMLPEGVLDGLKPFMDYNSRYGDAIHILISNTGSSNINEYAKRKWKDDSPYRAASSFNELEKIVRHSVFNEPGGFFKSKLIKSELIDHYVPFLPLEKSHVRKCIETELPKIGLEVTQHRIEFVEFEKVFFKTGERSI